MKLDRGTKEFVQFVMAGFMLIAGVALVFVSIFIPPKGVIDPTVITAFGLFLGFVGSVWGIEIKYDYKTKTLVHDVEREVRRRMNSREAEPMEEDEDNGEI